MAEFVTVMQERERMCRGLKCSTCGLNERASEARSCPDCWNRPYEERSVKNE